MSKRRISENYDDLNIVPQGYNVYSASEMSSFRHMRVKIDSISDQPVMFLSVDELKLCEIINMVDDFTGLYHKCEETKQSEVRRLIQKYPESTYFKPLKYSNQIIEIPINSNGNNNIQLLYNDNFPFRRDHNISLRVNMANFMEHISSYRNFKRLIIKNSKIKIVPNYLDISQCDTSLATFSLNCIIYSKDDPNIFFCSKLSENCLDSSNIFLLQKRLWFIMKNELNINDQISSILMKDLISIFDNMDQIELIVSVDNQLNVRILNILHSYYTT